MGQMMTDQAPKRVRDYKVTIRLNSVEYAQLLDMMVSENESRMGYFVRNIIFDYKPPKRKKINEKYLNQLAWIGNNLNQSAKALNIIKNQDGIDRETLANIAISLDNIQREIVILNENIEQDLADDS